MRVLLVDDDALLVDNVQSELTASGYKVDSLRDGRSAQLALEAEAYDLVLLDLSLPQLSGLDLLRAIRAQNNHAPVIVLTARDGLSERVEALDSGADDYLTKPFELEELKARMRALLRRGAASGMPMLTHGDLTLDPASRKVKQSGKTVFLSPNEFALLHALLLNVGRVVTRERLEQSLYRWEGGAGSNTLEVFLHRLRKKIGAQTVRTVRGVGYMIDRLE